MKVVCLFILLLVCKTSFSQNWTLLGNTEIDYISVAGHSDSIILFKKDSAAIAVPKWMYQDFHQLFLQDAHSLKMIYDSSSRIFTGTIMDEIDSTLQNFGIQKIVYFIGRTIVKKKDEEVWIMTSIWGQGLPCESYLNFKSSKNKTTPIQFLSFQRGMCHL